MNTPQQEKPASYLSARQHEAKPDNPNVWAIGWLVIFVAVSMFLLILAPGSFYNLMTRQEPLTRDQYAWLSDCAKDAVQTEIAQRLSLDTPFVKRPITREDVRTLIHKHCPEEELKDNPALKLIQQASLLGIEVPAESK